MIPMLKVPVSRKYSTISPLRYPGGKACLTLFITSIILRLEISKPHFIEPFAGGLGLSCSLYKTGIIHRIGYFDKDPMVMNFWDTITNPMLAKDLAERVETAPLTVAEYDRQKNIYRDGAGDSMERALAFLYLNRVNRSEILTGGLIGGREQSGKYTMGARFNRKRIADRILQVSKYMYTPIIEPTFRKTMNYYAHDKRSIMFLDPPYVQKGGSLYPTRMSGAEHIDLLNTLCDYSDTGYWLCTYDNAPLVAKYADRLHMYRFTLPYSVNTHRTESELLIVSSKVYCLLR